MDISIKAKNYGVALGVAIFVAFALYATIAANKASLTAPHIPTAITEPVTAPAEQLSRAYAAVAAHIKPAVVSVYSEKMVNMQELPFAFDDEFFAPFFGNPQPRQPRRYSIPQRGMGSGMILDKDGHILTNYHVVSDVDEIKVQLSDKRSFNAKLIGSDPKTDVAVIKIVGDIPRNLPIVQLGNSDMLEDGHLVMAIGAPFGLTQTVTHGIISAKGRSDVGVAAYEDFLQTDAPINPGNSGGPLVNMRGEVIGMNSAIATGGGQLGGEGQSAGVGFSIPSNMIKVLLPTLIKGGTITRGMLGVNIQDLDDDLAKNFQSRSNNGALVSQVAKGSPAEKAGIKSGDVIVKFGDIEINNSRQLRNLVAATTPGNTVKIKLMRSGVPLQVSAKIAKASDDIIELGKNQGKSMNQLANIGLKVQLLTPELALAFKLQEKSGILITDVAEGSAASAANLQVGDLILEANHEAVNNIEQLQTILKQASEQVLFLIKRNGYRLFVVLRLK